MSKIKENTVNDEYCNLVIERLDIDETLTREDIETRVHALCTDMKYYDRMFLKEKQEASPIFDSEYINAINDANNWQENTLYNKYFYVFIIYNKYRRKATYNILPILEYNNTRCVLLLEDVIYDETFEANSMEEASNIVQNYLDNSKFILSKTTSLVRHLYWKDNQIATLTFNKNNINLLVYGNCGVRNYSNIVFNDMYQRCSFITTAEIDYFSISNKYFDD